MPPSKHPGHFPSSDATAISNKEMRSSMVSVDAASKCGEKSQNCAELVVSLEHSGTACDTTIDDFQSNFRRVVEAWRIKKLHHQTFVYQDSCQQRGPIEKWTCHWGISSQPPALDEVGTSASMCQWLGLWRLHLPSVVSCFLPVPNEKPLCNKETRPRINQEVQ